MVFYTFGVALISLMFQCQELAALKELNAQLVEESNRIIGHTNTNQKIRLFDKKNQEYNELTKV